MKKPQQRILFLVDSERHAYDLAVLRDELPDLVDVAGDLSSQNSSRSLKDRYRVVVVDLDGMVDTHNVPSLLGSFKEDRRKVIAISDYAQPHLSQGSHFDYLYHRPLNTEVLLNCVWDLWGN